LTGDTAQFGIALQRGIILAQKNIPADTKYNYVLVFEDNANNLTHTNTIAVRMLNIDKVNAMISALDPPANIIAPMAERHSVIHLGSSWFPDFIKHDYSFNVYPIVRKNIELMAEELLRRNYKNVAVFTVNQSGAIKGTEFIKEIFPQKGINICADVRFNFGEKDFRTAIHRPRECKADIYVIQAFSPEADILYSQLREIRGNDVKVTGIDLALNVVDVSLYDGSWFVGTTIANPKFLEQYETAYQDDSYLHTYAAVGYDKLALIIHAFENAPAEKGKLPTQEDVLKTLQNTKDFEGAFGKISVDEGLVSIPFSVLKIENGKISKVAEE
jgi:ABC-type branched-subunit amino acid transport system substrate-binding protein